MKLKRNEDNTQIRNDISLIKKKLLHNLNTNNINTTKNYFQLFIIVHVRMESQFHRIYRLKTSRQKFENEIKYTEDI